MKILYISITNKGGQLHYLLQLANETARQGHRVVVISGKLERSLVGLFDKNIKLYEINNYLYLYFLNIINIIKIKKIINLERPETIHFLSTDITVLAYALLFRKNYYFFTLHDPEIHPGDFKFFYHLNKYLTEHSLATFVHGENNEKIARSHFNSKNVISISIGANFDFLYKYDRDNQFDYLRREHKYILFFGRILPYKGIENLIMAEPVISGKIEQYKIIIAGKGKIDLYLKLIKDKKKFVIINKFIEENEMVYLFKKASFIVLPYTQGTQTAVIPIAYTLKKPVIASNVGDFSSAVENGQTGYLIKPNDILGLAQKCIELLRNDNLTKKLGQNAYLRSRNELSWKNTVDKLIKTYSSFKK